MDSVQGRCRAVAPSRGRIGRRIFRGWAADAPATLPRPDQIADLKPLGQVSASFIVAVNGEGLWIVDQHVAHERVLFEQHLEARRAGKVEGQRLLMPMVMEFSPRQLVTYEKIAEELGANGFEVELMGPKSVAIQVVPAGIDSERCGTFADWRFWMGWSGRMRRFRLIRCSQRLRRPRRVMRRSK